MSTKGLALTLGVGAVAGAVGVLMLSRNNPARRLATQAANKMEDAAWRASDRLIQKMDM